MAREPRFNPRVLLGAGFFYYNLEAGQLQLDPGTTMVIQAR